MSAPKPTILYPARRVVGEFRNAFYEAGLSPAQLIRRINKLLDSDESTPDTTDYQVLYHQTEHIGSYFTVERSALRGSAASSSREENALVRTPGAHNTRETAQDAHHGVLAPRDTSPVAPRTLTYQCPQGEPDSLEPCYFVYQADSPLVPEVQTLRCARHERAAVRKGRS